LGKQGNAITEWLETNGLSSAARLAEKIEVDSGWQLAVETVLGFHLQSVCIDGITPHADAISQMEEGNLALFDMTASAGPVQTGSHSLLNKVKAPWALDNLLGSIRTADSFQEALAKRTELAIGESFITQEGIWVGQNWMRLNREEGETTGVLGREEEIRLLSERIESLEGQVDTLRVEVDGAKEQLQQAEQARETAQRELNELNRGLSDIRSSLSGKRTRAEHLKNRSDHIRNEVEELQGQREEGREEIEMAHERLHAALNEMETLGERRDALVARRDELSGQLSSAKEEATQLRARSHQIALQVESMRSAKDSLTQNLDRMQGQLVHLSSRREELQLSLEDGQVPLLEQSEELAKQLQLRVEVEQQLAKARQNLEHLDAILRGLEQDRGQAEQTVQKQRSLLDQAKMQRQEVLIRCKTVEEQLNETEFKREQLFLELPGDATPEAWQQEVERMDMRIRRLGAINLAAIDEFQEQSERMVYLDTQHADVTEALETLENAIRKIDRETRTRFKETFDKVNSGLQEKFPKLFGGGHAYLQLTGDDMLDTGVTVMARPPGKRNSSIHLLSGGEKALTAVALVFAIFELNPAPFCMLDEVDAPLDDANVGRFCELVKSMSEQVQFIFITHNKITMEIANQLTGVTMHEPGVSRLVSVDVSEAARLAAM